MTDTLSKTIPATSMESSGAHREEADDYRGEVWRSDVYRVAECRDGIQWLLQRRRATRTLGGAAWRTVAYCRSRKALIRLHQQLSGWLAPELARLPDVIGRPARGPNSSNLLHPSGSLHPVDEGLGRQN